MKLFYIKLGKFRIDGFITIFKHPNIGRAFVLRILPRLDLDRYAITAYKVPEYRLSIGWFCIDIHIKWYDKNKYFK